MVEIEVKATRKILSSNLTLILASISILIVTLSLKHYLKRGVYLCLTNIIAMKSSRFRINMASLPLKLTS